MLSNISQWLHEVNTLLATYKKVNRLLNKPCYLPVLPCLQQDKQPCQRSRIIVLGRYEAALGIFFFPPFESGQIPLA